MFPRPDNTYMHHPCQRFKCLNLCTKCKHGKFLHLADFSPFSNKKHPHAKIIGIISASYFKREFFDTKVNYSTNFFWDGVEKNL